MRGFTLIELVITILIISLFVAGIAMIMQQVVVGLAFSGDSVKALSLARLEMSKINNLSYSDVTLADGYGYNVTATNYEGSAYDLNRTVDYVTGTSNNLKEVNVLVYPTGTTDILSSLTTYVADINFGPGSGGGDAGGGGDEGGTAADSLSVSGGTVKNKDLKDVTLANTLTDSTITITGATVTFTGASGIQLEKIRMNGTNRWTGTEDSGSTITLTPSFILAIDTTYNKTAKFTFSENLLSATIVFHMSDGSSTTAYSW